MDPLAPPDGADGTTVVSWGTGAAGSSDPDVQFGVDKPKVSMQKVLGFIAAKQQHTLLTSFRIWRLLPLIRESKQEMQQATIALWHKKVSCRCLRAWRGHVAALAECDKHFQRALVARCFHAWWLEASKAAEERQEQQDLAVLHVAAQIFALGTLTRTFACWHYLTLRQVHIRRAYAAIVLKRTGRALTRFREGVALSRASRDMKELASLHCRRGLQARCFLSWKDGISVHLLRQGLARRQHR